MSLLRLDGSILLVIMIVGFVEWTLADHIANNLVKFICFKCQFIVQL